MLSVCPLLAVCILGALGTPSKRDRDSTKEEILSDLQLLLPIEYKGPPKSKDKYPKSESPGRLGLLSDGPYSRLPASEFTLDEDLFPPIHSPHKKTIKKDLSRTNPVPVKRTVHPPTDLAGSCLNYLFQRNLGELSRSSDIQNKQPINEMERELLSTLCKKYLGKIYVEDGETSKGKEAQNGFAGSFVGPGVGGEVANMGIGGQGAGNALVGGIGGLMRDVDVGGQGLYANNFRVNKNGLYTTNGLASGFGQNGGFEADGRGVFTGGKGIDNLYNALGVIGNVGVNGLGGYAGNLALDGLGSQTGNAGISGQGGVAGNAAFNGYGGLAGNVGVKGSGGKAGNLGVGGKGGLFGNLGIGGQGGFIGNVGIGTAGNQYLDFFQEPEENILNSPLPGFAANKAPSNQKVSLGYFSGQNGKEADFVFDGSSASHVVLEHGSSAPAQRPVELLSVSLVADGAGLGNQAAVGTANSKIDGVFGNIANADSELVDMQRVPKDKGQSQKVTPTTNASQGNKQGDSKAAARNQGQKTTQCLIGSLAYGGQGGQVGNLVVSGKATPGTGRDEHCAHCLHVFHVGARSGDAASADQDPGASAALTTKPSQSVQEPSAAADEPLVPSSKFRPPGSRRNWMVIDGRHSEKLRQYINSKKPWLLI